MGRAWKRFKYKLHRKFIDIEGDKNLIKAKDSCPEDAKKEDWVYLCDRWSDKAYKVYI